MGFQTAEFLSMVVPKQVRQSATGSQIVRGKTLRQAHYRRQQLQPIAQAA
jgi:hypothetical protein